MEQVNQKAEIRLKTIRPSGDVLQELLIAETEASRQSGFPVMARCGRQLYLAWTQVGANIKVQTARLNF